MLGTLRMDCTAENAHGSNGNSRPHADFDAGSATGERIAALLATQG